MELIFQTAKVKETCTSLRAAKKVFGGNKILAESLHARINLLKQAENLKDVACMPHLRLHPLENKHGRDLNGHLAIDVKTIKDPWRIIFQPLDENKEPYESFRIDQKAKYVQIVLIEEVSNHYE